jgi:hypothetical protein
MGEIHWGSVLATAIAGAFGGFLGTMLYIRIHGRRLMAAVAADELKRLRLGRPT